MWIGLELTLYGMGLVFLLLAIMWALIGVMTRIDVPPPVAETTGTGDERHGVEQPALRSDLLAAIVIACRAHRMARRKQAAPEMRTHEPGSLPSRWVSVGRTRQNRSWAPGGRYS